MNLHLKVIFCLSAFIVSTGAFAQPGLPVLPIKNINGSSVTFKSIIDTNDITVISFWATWCVPCINELDALQEKLDETKRRPFQLIAISTDEARTVQKVRPMAKSRGWTFGIYLDESNEIKRAFNVPIVPYVIILHKGKMVYQRSGYLQGDEDVLFEKLNQISTANNQ